MHKNGSDRGLGAKTSAAERGAGEHGTYEADTGPADMSFGESESQSTSDRFARRTAKQ